MGDVSDEVRPAGDLALVAALCEFPLLLADECARLARLPLPEIATADADDEPGDARPRLGYRRLTA